MDIPHPASPATAGLNPLASSIRPGATPVAASAVEVDPGDDPPSRRGGGAAGPDARRVDTPTLPSPLQDSLQGPIRDSIQGLAGMLIALATVIVPLVTVLIDRSTPLPNVFSTDPPRALHGSDATVGLSGSRGGQSGGRDPSRQPQQIRIQR